MEFEIGLICTVVGVVISYFAFTRNRDNDVKKDASENAVISTKLDTIASDVKSIRIDMKTEQLARMELSERVTRVEESSKQAHKRIDKLEEENYK